MKLKCQLTFAPTYQGLTGNSYAACFPLTNAPLNEPRAVLRTAMHREVLCHSKALPSCGDHLLATRWTLLHPRRSYYLMRQSKILCMPCSYTCACSLCRLPLAPAGRWTFPALICDSFPRCLDPYPGGICAAYDRFFTQITGLPRALTSRLEKYLATTK